VAPFVTQRRVVSALLALQTLLAVALAIYMWATGNRDGYALACSGGAVIYGALWWAYERGVQWARLVAVMLMAVLVVGSLKEPFLTGHPPLVLFLPPVLALIVASPLWVIGVAAFEFLGLLAIAGSKSALLRPGELVTFLLIVAGLLISRKVVEATLFDAERARGEAERRASDVLEQRSRADRLEGELLHAQRLESVGRLAGGVAHDFNNLLTVISGSATLAQRELPPDHAAVQDIDEIQNAAKRAAELTRQLLAFARRQVLVKKVFDARDLLVGIERMLSRLLGERVALKLEITAESLPVSADRGQIEQVIMNLVLNARDAMPDGGTVTISARSAPLPDQASGSGAPEYVELAVTDTGAGMSAEVKTRVFEPFFTTKELGRGTGLGLATSFGIVTQHDGHLLLDSQQGQGSSFRVYLPLAPGAAEENSRSIVRTLPRGRERVLLVEDDPHVRAVAARVLQDAGYGVQTASAGREALAYLEATNYDVLVSDVVMPGLSGVELAEKAISLRPALGVVLMSGYANALLEAPAIGSRTPEFVQKPFSARKLVEAVQNALAQAGASGVRS
jgi:signal transduction histidine kinase/ActR/RegA family two-component response regulator